MKMIMIMMIMVMTLMTMMIIMMITGECLPWPGLPVGGGWLWLPVRTTTMSAALW